MKSVVFILFSFFATTLRSADADSGHMVHHSEHTKLHRSNVDPNDVSRFFTSLFLHERQDVHDLLRMGVKPTQTFKGFTAIGRLLAGMYATQVFVDPNTHGLIEQRVHEARRTACILNLLLRHGADPNTPSNYTLPTVPNPVIRPLDFVTINKRENVAVALILLQAGANPFPGSLCLYSRDLHQEMRNVFDALNAFKSIEVIHELYQTSEGVVFMKKFWKACMGYRRPLLFDLYRHPKKCSYFKDRYFQDVCVHRIPKDGVIFYHMIKNKSK